jgi:hypothetical protein
MRAELRKVIHAFVTLRQLSPIPLIAWDLLYATMSSALLLGALDKVFRFDNSRDAIQKLIRALPNCDGKVDGEDGEAAEMAVAPFYHGLETLKHLVQ